MKINPDWFAKRFANHKIKTIRLKNYRSFIDTDNIDIKPINFLVGANSSGKSSILKFFPLLKQSVEGRNFNGVFRWREKGADVDFESFRNTVRQDKAEMGIELVFSDKWKVAFDIIQDNGFFDSFKSISVYNNTELVSCMGEKELKNAEKNYFLPFGDNNIDGMNDRIVDLALCISYIKPIRANIDRYSFVQNDSIDDILSDGANLPMFLYTLSSERFKLYNDFLIDCFGFGIELTQATNGQFQILIAEKDSAARNIVDVGYGYIELLPILTTIWNSMLNKSHPLIVIEQPEVHLHPKFQSKFACMLCKVIKNYPNVRFFIETHSETILNTIGREIDYKRASADDVNVLLIEKNNGISTVKST